MHVQPYLYFHGRCEEAVEVASRWPSARLGAIEVRPIEEALPTARRYM